MGGSTAKADLLRCVFSFLIDISHLTCDSGKILQDASTVESYKIEEKGFIVCMISKVCQLFVLSQQ